MTCLEEIPFQPDLSTAISLPTPSLMLSRNSIPHFKCCLPSQCQCWSLPAYLSPSINLLISSRKADKPPFPLLPLGPCSHPSHTQKHNILSYVDLLSSPCAHKHTSSLWVQLSHSSSKAFWWCHRPKLATALKGISQRSKSLWNPKTRLVFFLPIPTKSCNILNNF